MKQDINLKSLNLQLQKILKFEQKHLIFTAVMMILIVYICTVWKIGQLAVAEPDVEEQTAAENTGKLLRVDEAAIRQIEELEQRDANIQSLFNEARNNPFRE